MSDCQHIRCEVFDSCQLDGPDLTAELADAELIVTGEAAAIEIQWGVRIPGWRRPRNFGTDETTARMVAADAERHSGSLVSRKVTYGAWQDA
jgi:hypothetical protein